MANQTVKLDMTPGCLQSAVSVSQYDDGSRSIDFELYKDGAAYSIPSGAIVTINGRKPDGNVYSVPCTYSGNKVTVTFTKQMTAVDGSNIAEISIVSGSTRLGSANFKIIVEKSPLSDNAVVSDSQIPLIEEAGQHAAEALISRNAAADYAKQASDSAAKAAASASSSAEAANAAITAEVTRAKDAEAAINTQVSNNSAAITAEVTRAKGAEADLNTQISNLLQYIGTEIIGAKIIDTIHPIGSILITVSSTNPGSLPGYAGTTWEEIKGRFLLAHDESHPAASTGGEYQHTLTVGELPKHRHSSSSNLLGYASSTTGNDNYITWVNIGTTFHNEPDTGEGGAVRTSWVGGDQPHNNTPPYLSVYMWKRIG